jgi:hypothetical protein
MEFSFSYVSYDKQSMKREDQDAATWCLLLTSVSTCFGHHYAHLQENKGPGYCTWCVVMVLLDVVGSGCGSLSCRMWVRSACSRCGAKYVYTKSELPLKLPLKQCAYRCRSSVLPDRRLHKKWMLHILTQFYSYCPVCGRLESDTRVIPVVSGRRFSK